MQGCYSIHNKYLCDQEGEKYTKNKMLQLKRINDEKKYITTEKLRSVTC